MTNKSDKFKISRIIILTFFLISIYACSTTRTVNTFLEYHSDKLCKGIKNMTEYFENCKELKTYLKDRLTDTINLKYEVDTLVNEGIPLFFLSR